MIRLLLLNFAISISMYNIRAYSPSENEIKITSNYALQEYIQLHIITVFNGSHSMRRNSSRGSTNHVRASMFVFIEKFEQLLMMLVYTYAWY